MRYSIEEAQFLYDSLPFINPFTYEVTTQALATDHRTKLLFRFGDYCILVTSAQHAYEIINIDVMLKAWSKDVALKNLNNLLQCRQNVKKICHEVPLEEVPLYINDESVKYIAAWRLRIAR